MATSTILHLDQPRSGGHLLQRMLSGQTRRHFLDHPFSQTRGKQVQWLTGGSVSEGMSAQSRREWDVELQKGIAAWETGVEEAAKDGKLLMFQDHCFNPAAPETVLRILDLIEKGESGPEGGENVTHLPEHLLLQPGLIPVFTIRDPRLAVPSAYRVLKKFGLPQGGGRANFSISTNPIWIRILYNWYVDHGIEPVIVDCDDIQCSGETDFMQRLCVKLGLDPETVLFKWPRISDEERQAAHPAFYASQSTLLESEGIHSSLAARNWDLEKEEEGWEEEFGEDAGLVREMVQRADVHWRWLMERRLL